MGKSVIRATGVVLIMNALAKILGFLRDMFIGNAFGASSLTDSYLIAYTIPYFLQAILGYALVAAVVPILTRHLVDGNKEEAWYVGSSIINIMALLLGAAALVGILISGILVHILAPGFDPEQMALTTSLTRVMFPSLIFMGVGMVLTGIANASYKFALPAFAPALSSLIIILTVVFFAGAYGIFGLATGTLVSFIGFFLIQIPVLWQIGFKYKFTLGLKHPDIRRILREIVPIILGIAVNQIYFALNRIFASGLADGSISVLNFANKLMMLPLGIFVAAVVSAIYPSLSELALKRDHRQLAATLKKGLGLVCLVAIPAAVGLGVLAAPIVQLLFERGAFDHAATMATACALIFFVIGLVPMAANMVLTRAFYAVGDVKTPVKIGVYSIIINLILSVILFKPLAYGGGGLALSNSLAALAGTLWMYYHLKRKCLPALKEGNFLLSFLKMAGAAVIMAAAVLGTKYLLLRLGIDMATTKGVFVVVAGCICVGIVVYIAAIFAFKLDETKMLVNVVKRKLGRGTKAA